jgi:drug/metabolite transporter (DMT)-like permease
VFTLLAVGSAALYGAADFLGGLSARHGQTMLVVVVSQFAGMVLVALALPFGGVPVPPLAEWVWGAIAGLAGGIGVALLYRALAVGVMSLVAPVTAVCAVIVPLAVAVAALGERPAGQAAVGMGIAVVAIVLVSRTEQTRTTGEHGNPRRGLGLALASGVAIGLFFLALARTSSTAGLWPLFAARGASVLLFSSLVAVQGTSFKLSPSVLPIAIAGGIVDMLANWLYLLASRRGPLTIVVTLASLYPASTVLLARVVLHERLTRHQWVGVALALAAIVMIVSG